MYNLAVKAFTLLFLISFNAHSLHFEDKAKYQCSNNTNTDQVLSCEDYKKLNQITQQKPYKNVSVIGASVSDNYGGVDSPGDRVAGALDGKLFKHAKPHKSSHTILKDESKFQDQLKNSDLVIAIDLFFWNSVKEFWPNQDCSENIVKDQIKELIKVKGKLVLGEVPILRSSQDIECTRKINKVINDDCKKVNNCLVLNEDQMLPRDGNVDELFQSDGLHLSNKGAQYMSDKICEHLYLSEI